MYNSAYVPFPRMGLAAGLGDVAVVDGEPVRVSVMTDNQARAQAQVRRAAGMREKAVAVAMRRKEEYLGARVPRELRERVLERAEALGIPVSILIRNVLEEYFGAGAGAADGQTARKMSSRVSDFNHVLGWEEITLNKRVECARCGVWLQPGMRVTLGLIGPGEGHVILCDRCKESI